MANLNAKLPPNTGALPSLNLPIKKNIINSDEDDEDDELSASQESEEKIESVSEKKMDPNGTFFATFIDGSSLRYLIEYLRMISIEGTFVFSKEHITYQKQDEDCTILNDVKLKTYELTEYDFSSINSEIVAAINLSDLRNKTRTVGKKEQLNIYRRAGEPSNFYIQVCSQEKGAGDNPMLHCMPMKGESVEIIQLPSYSRGKHNPNCTIYQNDFSKVCKALVANKCSYTEFIGFEKGIIIKGYSSDGRIVMVKEYGKCKSTNKNPEIKGINVSDKSTIKPQISAPRLNVRDAGEIERFKIHVSNIKALAKINGFSATGTLKFYIEPDLPMKITTSIGTFGKLSILIRSC